MEARALIASCTHCGLDAVNPIEDDSNIFCCYGCKSVYHILNLNGLSEYYHLKKNSTLLRDATAANKKEKKYSYLNNQNFIDDYAIEFNRKKQMSFFVEGIHCFACSWLIEKLPAIDSSNVSSAKVNLSSSVITITLNEGSVDFCSPVELLQSWGYSCHPIKSSTQAQELSNLSDRNDLMRIGVAAACLGNLMLFSVSIYAGVEGFYKSLFEFLSSVIFIPIVTYCSYPFYKTVFYNIKKFQFSIDVPIVLALVLGSVAGLNYLFTGIGDLYFDTLAALVFLILGSRYILKKTKQKGLEGSDLKRFFSHSNVLKRVLGNYEQISAEYIEVEDILKIECDSYFPVDCEVLEGRSVVDNSFISGESQPQEVQVGDCISSGVKNLSGPLIVKALSNVDDSRLGKILDGIESNWSKNSKFLSSVERFSKYLVVIAILISIACFIYYFDSSPKDALLTSLGVLIITCPCALGLITPLIFSNSLKLLASKGIIVKEPSTLEKIQRIKNIYLDKTGTITHGQFRVHRTSVELQESTLNAVYSLEKKSNHPLANSLVQHLSKFSPKKIEVENFQEILGIGVRGIIQGDLWEVKGSGLQLLENIVEYSQTQVGVYCNSQLLATITLVDTIRKDSKDIVNWLKGKSSVFILSGDKKHSVLQVANKLDIEDKDCFWEMSPEAKKALVTQTHNCLMIGDGANDAAALRDAYVGVATKGDVEISLRASDAYFLNEGLGDLKTLFFVSSETLKLLKLNIFITMFYNIVGITLAVMGYVNPLTAAIFMPASSVLLSLLSFHKFNLLKKKLGRNE